MQFLGFLSAAIGGSALAVAIIGLLAAYRGWALTILWAWFLVPLGAPVLSIPIAIGISLILGMLISHKANKQTDISDAGVSLITPLVFLLFGWIVTLFM